MLVPTDVAPLLKDPFFEDADERIFVDPRHRRMTAGHQRRPSPVLRPSSITCSCRPDFKDEAPTIELRAGASITERIFFEVYFADSLTSPHVGPLTMGLPLLLLFRFPWSCGTVTKTSPEAVSVPSDASNEMV